MSFAALYAQPTRLAEPRFRGVRFKRPEDHSAASRLNACFVGIGEFAEVAKEYVIGFVPTQAPRDGVASDMSPVALLGVRPQENLFLSPGGRWDARYVPAFVRRYPFAYGITEATRHEVVVDAACPGLGHPEGELLVSEDGGASPLMREVTRFLDIFEEEVQRTQVACARIVQLGLLKSVQIDITLPDGNKVQAGGVHVVDEAKLRALSGDVVLELLRSGLLGLVHAHVLSTTNLASLTDRLAARLGLAQIA